MHDDRHIRLAELSNELPAHSTRARRASRLRICGDCQGLERSIAVSFEDRGAQCYSLSASPYWVRCVLNIGSGDVSTTTSRDRGSTFLDEQRRADFEVRVPTCFVRFNTCPLWGVTSGMGYDRRTVRVLLGFNASLR